MTYAENQLLNSSTGPAAALRVEATSIMPKTFATGSATLAPLTPVAFNTSTDLWVAWGAGASTKVVSITAGATTATDGTFLITLDGTSTAAIDHDANAAAIKAAIILLDDFATGNVTVQDFGSGLGTNDGGCYIYFLSKNPLVAIDTTLITGTAHALATVSTDASEITTLTANATTATDGDFTITIDGETTAALNHDDDDATIQAAILLLSNVESGDVLVRDSAGGLGTNSGVATLIFQGNFSESSVDVSFTLNLTGNDHVLATMVAGVASTGAELIKGFVWPDEIVLDASNDVLGQVLIAGKLHYADIPVVTGQYQEDLKVAIQTQTRPLGLLVQGLANVR